MARAETRGMLNDPRADTGTAAVAQRYALDMPGLAAFAIYLGLAFLFFARGLVGHFSTAYIGKGTDPQLLMWLMAWWPHAIRHGLNPLYTRAVWAPHGANLAWTTCMPLLSLIFTPGVLIGGPVFAYNIACLLAVALAGWSSFIFCRYFTPYWPSIIGGYLFCFSAYMLSHSSQLDVILVFPIPLYAWLLSRQFQGDISLNRFLIGITLILTTEFLFFVELFASIFVFTAIAIIIGLNICSAIERKRIVEMLPALLLGYALTALAVSPYVYFMLSGGYKSGASHPPLLYSIDLLNLLIPTPTMEIGRLGALQAITGHFLGVIFEAGGYVGIPVLLIIATFARKLWRQAWCRVLIVFFIATVILSLGPYLLVDGRVLIPLPGALIALLPIMDKALPARFMIYAFLAVSLITALWLSSETGSRWLRFSIATAAILLMLPNLSTHFWTSHARTPIFFDNGRHEQYLAHGETIVALPYSYNGDSMLWQLKSDWYFRMAGGNVGPPPLSFRRWPAVRAFYRVDNFVLPDAGNQLRAFLAAHQAHAVLVDDREATVWRPLMATLNVTPIRAGGVTLYRVPPSELASWKNATALEMETRAAQARFAALVLGAEAWLRRGGSLTSVTPAEVLRPTALPEGWVAVPAKIQPPYAEGGLNLPQHAVNPHRYAGMWLAANENGTIQVGIAGWYAALRQVLNKYRAYAIDFTPHNLADVPAGAPPDRRGMLIMSFNSDGLHQAAELARSNPQ